MAAVIEVRQLSSFRELEELVSALRPELGTGKTVTQTALVNAEVKALAVGYLEKCS